MENSDSNVQCIWKNLSTIHAPIVLHLPTSFFDHTTPALACVKSLLLSEKDPAGFIKPLITLLRLVAAQRRSEGFFPAQAFPDFCSNVFASKQRNTTANTMSLPRTTTSQVDRSSFPAQFVQIEHMQHSTHHLRVSKRSYEVFRQS